MIRYLATLVLVIISLSAYSQAPTGMYGEYKYSYTIESNGDIIERTTFPRIRPVVFTANFGFVQSTAKYNYMGIGGEWFPSTDFAWAGFQNGWYVYTYRLGTQYGYFLISKDYNISNINIYKFSAPKNHINGYEMRNHINNSEFINIE